MDITIERVMSWNPCKRYTRKRVKELFAGRKTLTALEVLDLDIPADDRLWVVLREGVLDDESLWSLACDFAEHVLHLYESAYPGDDRPRVAIKTRRAWLRGEASDEEMDVAGDDAKPAAETAAESAHWDAAWAARAAVWSAFGAAPWAAFGAAGDAAARVADRAAEREWQVARVREVLVREGEGDEVDFT